MSTEPFNKLSAQHAELLALLIEECSEVQKAACKILRHGQRSHNPDGDRDKSNQDHLQEELGHVLAAMRMLHECGYANNMAINVATGSKLENVMQYLHHASTSLADQFTLTYFDGFVDSMWIYDPAKHGSMPEMGYVALAITGEAGEIAEKVKKAYRETDGAVINEDMLKELGDVLFYIIKLSHLIGSDLRGVISANIKKLSERKARGTMHGNGDNR